MIRTLLNKPAKHRRYLSSQTLIFWSVALPSQLRQLSLMDSTHAVREDELSEAIAWDEGCRRDAVRNRFIVPRLVQVFSEERPAHILDIGAGTGYIPRSLDCHLDYRPDWTLLDIDNDRLRLAHLRKPPAMRMRSLVGIFADLVTDLDSYQAVMLTFTLLEAEDSVGMIQGAVGLLADDGILIIAVPDVWRDALAMAEQEPSSLRRLISETVDLPKTDKFTNLPYPFYAMRTESLISAVLARFCVLEKLERGGPQDDIYLLIFRKRVAEKMEIRRG